MVILNFKEIFMKIRAKKQASGLNQRKPFFAAMLMVALMASAAIAAGPIPVNLGTAGNFIILAKTGISVIGTTSIMGILELVRPLRHILPD